MLFGFTFAFACQITSMCRNLKIILSVEIHQFIPTSGGTCIVYKKIKNRYINV